MSLEEALLKHAESIDRLANALIAGQSIVTSLGKAGEAAAARQTVTHRPTPPVSSSKAAPTDEQIAAATTPSEAKKSLKYEDIRAAFMRLGELKGTAVSVALLGKFGVKNGKEIKPERYQEFADSIKEQLPADEIGKLALFHAYPVRTQ